MTAALAQTRDRLSALTGWRRYSTALVLGAAAATAFPPIYLLPLLPVCFTALLWMIPDGAGGRRLLRGAFALGWWFGFGHFVAGLYWITNALLVDPSQFGWLVPFAVAGLSAYFAIFPAAAVVLAALARRGWPRVLAFAGAWALGEGLRGILLTGFPWNPMGSALAVTPALMQGAAVVGVYGLSFLVVAMAAAPAALAETRASRAARIAPVALAAVVFAALWAGGAVRLALAPASDPDAEAGPRLRIVQAAIDQRLKWRADELRRNYMSYVELSDTAPKGSRERAPDAVIWPETAVPYLFDGSRDYLRAVAQSAPPGGLLVTGVVRTAGGPGGPGGQLWNSVIAVTAEGALAARYDKHHLVPFGEYVPLRRFNPLPKLTEGRVDFAAGPGPATLVLPGLPPVSPLVCYEVIFPGAVVAEDAPRPHWLLNLTNDAWFGATTGPRQHLAAARLRAVEEGLPVIRAANTGISAAIDPYGRELARIDLGVRGTRDVTLPRPADHRTPFSRLGNLPFLALALSGLGLGLMFRRGV